MDIAKLFRQEVIDARYSEDYGHIDLRPPRLGWFFLASSLLIVTLLFVLLVFGRYTRRESVAGSLVPKGGVLTVSAKSAGTVARVFTQLGARVHPGQSLLEISSERRSATLGNTLEASTSQLEIERQNLRGLLEQQAGLWRLREKELNSHIELIDQQISRVDDQIRLQTVRATSSMDLYEQWARLGNSGVVSKLQLLQQHDSALQNAAQLKELQRQEVELKQQLLDYQSQIAQIPFKSSADRLQVGQEIADVTRSISENEAQRTAVLSVDSDGTVASLLARQGEQVVASQPLLTVIPSNGELLAEFWIRPTSIGFIKNGTDVVLHYKVKPDVETSFHRGRVVEVAQISLTPHQLESVLGREIKEARYRVLVSIPKGDQPSFASAGEFSAGMMVEGEFPLERRRLIYWVFDMLYQAEREAGTSLKEGVAHG